MLFKVPPLNKGTIKKENPEIDSVPEFAELTDKQLRLIILMFDYKSPFRQKPQKERWPLAFLAAGYAPQDGHNATFDLRAREIMNGTNKKVADAIKKYLEIQHDEDVELLDVMQKQIDNIKAMVKKPWEDPADVDKVNKLVMSLPDLREKQRELAKNAKIDFTYGEPEEEQNKTLSTMDKMVLDESNEV